MLKFIKRCPEYVGGYKECCEELYNNDIIKYERVFLCGKFLITNKCGIFMIVHGEQVRERFV